ncbi:glycoside hydrolase family 81 protein [Clavulina sp. PMI_390]|nr:glycoside hydrolase family 81 protein [Clavulina sp. PMI_390]
MWSLPALLVSSWALSSLAIPGPIDTAYPGTPGGNIANDAPPVASFFAGSSPPYPTDDWWSGFAATPGTAVVAGPYPYQSNLQNSTVNFGVSTSRTFDGTSIKQPTQTDYGVGFKEHSGAFANHKALSWDFNTVQVQYFQGTSTMTTYFVPGSPYMTFLYASATPLITSYNGQITTFNGVTVTTSGSELSSATGTKFTVVNSSGTYLIYALSSITLTATPTTITASATFNGVLRMVKLTDPSHATLLDAHYTVYPTALTVGATTSGNTGTLTYTWTTTGTASNLLMLTFPHHRQKMTNLNLQATTALYYLTTKGYMYANIGNVWTMSYTLSTITWNAPRAPDSSCTSTLIKGVTYEGGLVSSSSPSVPGDFYYWGGAMAAQGRLALIAEVLGQTSVVNNIVSYMVASFQSWFSSSSAILAAYETGWGGIINKAGYNNVYVDFGNGYYNDHHFHYGYFLTAAAIIAKYNPSWMNSEKSYINGFLRDIVNPSRSDPYFPIVRHRDWFAGHSWASGIANGAGSRDQESSGEAINGYYGAALWANVTGQTDIYNWCRLLIATEQHGVQTYWQMNPSSSSTDRDQPYPEPAVRNLVTMGNVEDWQSGAWLFWGSEKSEIAAIQMLPVTPINEVTVNPTWANNVFNYAQSELTDPTIGDEWKCVIYDAYSNYNPSAAASLSTNLASWGSGNSYTNTLYYIATRPGASGVCNGMPSNPVGTYKIQAVSSGSYVTLSSNNLVASTTSASATTFNLAWLLNAGTIYATSNSMYVTADQAGTDALSAARTTASTWEQFVIRQKVGAATGVYSIKAISNGLYVTLGSGGTLINGGATESASAGFKFV